MTYMNYIKSIFRETIARRKMSTWPTETPKWDPECLKLLQDGSTAQLSEANLNVIIQKSKDFPIKFPVPTMLCQNLIKSAGKETLERNIRSVYPILHEHSLYLCAKFLLFKRNHGTEKEQNFYKNVSLKGLIERLLSKRAVTFLGSCDSYVLLDNSRGAGLWEIIGTEKETHPLILENCLSYAEIKLSALLSVSSYTYFLNDGNRSNAGFVQPNRETLQEEGIIIGLIGTRFEREEQMEYQEIVVSQTQNTVEKGYGTCQKPSLQQLFAEFYEDTSVTYNDRNVLQGGRFFKVAVGEYFDNIAYKKRLALSFDTLLIEANHRAREQNKTAYIHVVGIGLGVWKISSHQTQLFVDTFGERIKFLGKNLTNVSDVHFAYILGAKDCLGFKNGNLMPIEEHPEKGITIHISRREPHSKLEEGKLLVASYVWVGNALPGNEFWVGMLTSTGDCAAACSTQIAELHNPHINPLVCAENLHVAMLDGTVRSINDVADLLNDAQV